MGRGMKSGKPGGVFWDVHVEACGALGCGIWDGARGVCTSRGTDGLWDEVWDGPNQNWGFIALQKLREPGGNTWGCVKEGWEP